jgi:hypothetical protein
MSCSVPQISLWQLVRLHPIRCFRRPSLPQEPNNIARSSLHITAAQQWLANEAAPTLLSANLREDAPHAAGRLDPAPGPATDTAADIPPANGHVPAASLPGPVPHGHDSQSNASGAEKQPIAAHERPDGNPDTGDKSVPVRDSEPQPIRTETSPPRDPGLQSLALDTTAGGALDAEQAAGQQDASTANSQALEPKPSMLRAIAALKRTGRRLAIARGLRWRIEPQHLHRVGSDTKIFRECGLTHGRCAHSAQAPAAFPSAGRRGHSAAHVPRL